MTRDNTLANPFQPDRVYEPELPGDLQRLS